MRLLHLTDTHLGVDRWFVGAPKGWRRADDHLAAMTEALQPAFRDEVDLVVHTGDLFDRSRPPARAIAQAAELLTAAARHVPVLLLPGNHDRRGLAHHFPEGLPGVRVEDRPTRLSLAGLDIAVVPHFRRAVDWAAAAAPFAGADLLVCHQSFHGAQVPHHTFRHGAHEETVAGRQIPRVKVVLCGHIHPRQVLEFGPLRVVFPGATERTSFTERHEAKGYATWDFGPAQPSFRFVDLPARPMRVVQHPGEVDEIAAGTLVHVNADAPEAIEEMLTRRGAWLTPRARPTAQLGLFAR